MLNGVKATKELLNALDNAKKPQTNADRIRAMSAVEFVEDSPTVDAVEVVHGRWNPFGGSGYRCSICDFWVALRSQTTTAPTAALRWMEGIKVTAKELHTQKIIPLRLELQRLEQEYRELYRKECGEKIGEQASWWWMLRQRISVLTEKGERNE